MPSEDRIIREKEVKAITSLGRTTRFELEKKGQFPKRIQLTKNAVGWRESDILRWMETRPPAEELGASLEYCRVEDHVSGTQLELLLEPGSNKLEGRKAA